MPKLYDISATLVNGFPVWPGDPEIRLEQFSRIEDGAEANVSQLCMPVHGGTHMDAPYHFVQGGKTIEELPLEVLIGPAQVIQLADSVKVITGDIVRSSGIQRGIERVLFKTRNSQYWIHSSGQFHQDFTAMDADGAQAIVDMGIKLVGIDYFSIAPFDSSVPTHTVLLGNGVAILETCNLSQVEPGLYTLAALPIKLGGSDGAPTRAVLISIL
ncbi:MAG TPA: cyclase family protein [Anaerolineaceae bacterium]|nr:cyclase family protein [Anaerolineaceae bacterium]